MVIPTETVYGLAALGTSGPGFERLMAAREALAGKPLAGPSGWHAGSAQAVLDTLQPPSAMSRRIIRRLTPGPVTFLIEMEPDRLTAARHVLRVGAGILDDGKAIIVRTPEHAVARELADRVQGPMVAEAIPTAGGAARDVESARTALAKAGVAVAGILDGGTVGQGKPSALVRLKGDGTFTVEREGAYDREYIQRRVDRTILFVCTGNTCRSPMAQAIAAGLLGPQREGSVRTHVRSAGLGASGGEPISPFAAEAVGKMGYTPAAGGARGLSAEAVEQAEAVYVMTRSHLRAVHELAPSARDRVFLLNPRGEDIADPIGGPAAQYSSLASEMKGMIQRRLKELDT